MKMQLTFECRDDLIPTGGDLVALLDLVIEQFVAGQKLEFQAWAGSEADQQVLGEYQRLVGGW